AEAARLIEDGALDLAVAGQRAHVAGVAAAAVGVLVAEVALDAAAARRLADGRSGRAVLPAVGAAALADGGHVGGGAAGAGEAVHQAVAGARGHRLAGARAGRADRADGGAAVGVLVADVADLGAEGDRRRRGAQLGARVALLAAAVAVGGAGVAGGVAA